jgi:trehalose 6-phosphate phosphatase
MKPPPLDERCALFLDVDGTLLHYADRPQDVRVDASLHRLISRVQAALGGALALISGRALAQVDALFAPLVLPASGQHGVERRNALGRVHTHAFPAPAEAAARLAAFAAGQPGLIFEDKGASLALHYRLAPHLGAAARREMWVVGQELGPRFQLLEGNMVYELKPAARSKGLAIRDFMDELPFRGRLPVFVGDDITDEHGFDVVNRLGGHSVKVGVGATCATARLCDVDAVHAWLASGPGPGRREVG